jgi:ferredoxin
MSETLTHSPVAFGTATLRFFRWTNRAVGLAKTVEFGAMAAVGQYERWARREDAMNVQLTKQHLNDPDICIRCDTCEETCLVHAVTHDDNNCVVKTEVCEKCMEHHTMPDRGDRQLARGIATLHDRRAIHLEGAATARQNCARGNTRPRRGSRRRRKRIAAPCAQRKRGQSSTFTIGQQIYHQSVQPRHYSSWCRRERCASLGTTPLHLKSARRREANREQRRVLRQARSRW